MVGLMMRNVVNTGVAVLALTDPTTATQPGRIALMVIVGAWSLARLLTRSYRMTMLIADYVAVLLVCLSIPLLVSGPDFHTTNTVPQAIAGTAVVSISVSVPARTSFLMTLGIAAAYSTGAAMVMDWQQVTSVTAVYYFAVQWATASAIRAVLTRVAAAVDQSRSGRHAAELEQRVADAVSDYQREQLALLHDTAASTLLMAGQGGSMRPGRLAAQARRDLDLLRKGGWIDPARRIDLVAALRDCARLATTTVEFYGHDTLWLAGETAKPIVSAAREVMTNVDRHANASALRITVTPNAVRLEDDGVGFDLNSRRRGRGLDESIIGRMHRAGFQADVSSIPSVGTTTQLSWPSARTSAPAKHSAIEDPDRFIDRVRARYSIALVTYSLVNLAITVPPAAAAHRTVAEIAMGIAAAISSLAAIPGVLRGEWRFAPPAATVLLVIAIAQPLLLPTDLMPGYAFWAQGAIGWCMVPLVLALPARAGAAVLVGYWTVGSIAALSRDAAAEVWLNIGLGTASILGVQLFALIFNGLVRDAAATIEGDNLAQQELSARQQISQALRAEYQRRYAGIVDNVVPLLEELSDGRPLDADLQHRARAESRRLRALFEQAGIFDHPLMQRIRTLINAAEARQVEVVIDVAGTIPDLQANEIDGLIRTVDRLLVDAATYARVVVSATPELIEISVVCDSSGEVPGDVDVDVVSAGGQTWCLIRLSIEEQ